MSNFICANCEYFAADEYAEFGYGACHRYPPQFFFTTRGPTPVEQTRAKFPSVLPDDWCGEFKIATPTDAGDQ